MEELLIEQKDFIDAEDQLKYFGVKYKVVSGHLYVALKDADRALTILEKEDICADCEALKPYRHYDL